MGGLECLSLTWVLVAVTSNGSWDFRAPGRTQGDAEMRCSPPRSPLRCSSPTAQSWAQLCWGGHRPLVPLLVALCCPWGPEKWVEADSDMVKSPSLLGSARLSLD